MKEKPKKRINECIPCWNIAYYRLDTEQVGPAPSQPGLCEWLAEGQAVRVLRVAESECLQEAHSLGGSSECEISSCLLTYRPE